MTDKYYVFSEKTGKCYVLDGEKNKKELELVSNNAFQWRYRHDNANLTIEKQGNKVITARLETDHDIEGIIQAWEDEDRGRAVWDLEKKGYVLKYELPKIFYLFNNQHKKRPWKFTFHQHHLILKDKDERKPYYWYYYDYTEELSTFIYEELKWYITVKKWEGEIVAIPSERGQALYPWTEADYSTNDYYCGEDEEYKDYNFALETADNWKKKNWLPTALVITFLPTYFKNYELKRGEKLTGTTWFKKIWEVFGSRGIPIVVKCYRSWVYINLYRNYRTLYDQISSITELPAEIDGREVGKSNLLVYFNMPFLPKKINYKYP